jgi:MinD-like ATPase involved in chromosome partitioning or flagellar assembly
VDGTETGWGRPAEPAPRWRALLDRARHNARAAEEQAEEDRESPAPPPIQQQHAQPLPSRPVSAERRPFNPLEARAAFDPQGQYEREQRSEPRQPESRQPESRQPESRQPEQRQPESRQPEPYQPAQRVMPQRPINPLDPRWQARQGETKGRRPTIEPEQPHSFFNPSRPAPQQPPARDYPQVRASGSATVQPMPQIQPMPQVQPLVAQPLTVQPQTGQPQIGQPQIGQPHIGRSVASPAVAPAPTSPAAARIEWRQTRPDEEMERAVAVLRRKLGRPRVLAFANPKGGVHKTTATVLAAATIGSVRGRGVLAWDDNELRGTLGLRAGSARHARTIKHLLADLMQIENLHGDALLGELDGYLRHASDGSYDVLAGEENPRFAQRLDQTTVRRVMDLLRRTHDVVCVDTGNNVESVNWQTVMRQADQLVITTVPREDAAFTADWMLDVLDESGMGDLVAGAVTLISCPSPGPLPLLDDFQKHFATRTRAVAVVPYDPALEVGSSIEYAELQPETRQAWLRAASVMIEPFGE